MRWRNAALIVAAFALLCAPAADGAIVVDQLLAVVNNQTIALSDLYAYRLLWRASTTAQLLQQAIEQKVLMREATRFDIPEPETARVRQAVAELEQSYGGAASWQAARERAGVAPGDIEQLVSDQLRIETFLVQRVDSFVFVSPTEVQSAYEAQTARFTGTPVAEAERVIEQELVKKKAVEKRQEYVARLRARAAIKLLAAPPDELPTRP